MESFKKFWNLQVSFNQGVNIVFQRVWFFPRSSLKEMSWISSDYIRLLWIVVVLNAYVLKTRGWTYAKKLDLKLIPLLRQ